MSHRPAFVPAWTFRNHWMTQIAGHAEMRPNATALRYLGVTTTWKQLHERALAFAGALARRGVSRGDRVLLLTLNRPEFVEAVLGINHLGAIAIPINFRLAAPEMKYLVEDSGSSVLVVDSPLAKAAAALRAIAPALKTVIGFDDVPDTESYEALLNEGEPFEQIDISEEETALIMYTSGTTGNPKGAMLSHKNMQCQAVTCVRANMVWHEDDVGFLTAPFFHIAGLGSIAPNLMLGIPTVIHPLRAFDPAEIIEAWEREGATVVFNVPQQWQAICAHPSVKDRKLELRIISWGAAPASDSILRAMSETFPDAINVAVFGQTEMSPITCVLTGEDSRRKLGSVGRPIPTIQYRIVDDDMNDVPVGRIGEIVYRGPTTMQGYWNKPAETEAAFAGGWFHSGDLVKQDEEGFVWVVDRKKDMIISGGENIYSAEVENVLFGHPKIREAAVVGRPDAEWGEVPVAIVVLAGEESIELEELRGYLDEHLARFKHPKAIRIIDALPRNAGGKVLKGPLRELVR